jgi:hypothetical protein
MAAILGPRSGVSYSAGLGHGPLEAYICVSLAVLLARFAMTLSRTGVLRLLEKVVVEPGLEMRVQCMLQLHHGVNHLGLQVRPLGCWKIA